MTTFDTIHLLMRGALIMATAIAAVFFVRFWRTSRDRLFLFFSAAFSTLAVDWAALAILGERHDVHRYVFLVRLVAFGLIVIGIIDKNRRTRGPHRSVEDPRKPS